MKRSEDRRGGSIFTSGVTNYEAFLAENQRKVNLMLNKVLRFSILIGPLLMLAIRLGVFHSVSYASCIVVSLLVMSLSCVHYVLIGKPGKTVRAAVIAFIAIDSLLILMNSAHIGIYITWFIVPLLSLLFCDFRIYALAVAINYGMMTASVWLVSPYYASLRVDFDRAFQYFAGRMGGFTIEMAIMVLAGYSLCRISTSYYRELIETIQDVDRQKRKEAQLIQITMTDELTRLNNRRSFDADVAAHEGRALEPGFVIFSVDVNGLKEANDTRGHEAGDALLTATARCLAEAIGPVGKVYRTGGDEFLAIATTEEPQAIAEQIARRAAGAEGLSLSVGYAAHSEHPDADIHALEVLADEMMYREKERYYSTPGVDRRRRGK